MPREILCFPGVNRLILEAVARSSAGIRDLAFRQCLDYGSLLHLAPPFRPVQEATIASCRLSFSSSLVNFRNKWQLYSSAPLEFNVSNSSVT